MTEDYDVVIPKEEDIKDLDDICDECKKKMKVYLKI